MVRKIIDKLAWMVLFVAAVPTTLVIATWNSLPGDTIFPMKLALERTLLVAVSPSYATSGQLQVKYTERRFAEVERLLAERHSVTGLPYLTQQVETTKAAIEKAPDPQTQQVLTRQYIATLTQVSYGLEQQKQAIVSGSPSLAQTGGGAGIGRAGGSQISPGIGAGGTPNREISPKPLTTVTAVENPPETPLVTPKVTLAPQTSAVPTLVVTASVVTTTPVKPETAVVALQITQAQEKIQEAIAELEKKQKERKGEDEKKGEADDKQDRKKDRQKD